MKTLFLFIRTAAGVVLLCSNAALLHAQTFTSSNLPIVLINTNGQTIVDEPKITADLSIIDNGPGVRNNLTDPPNHYKGKIGIEIRGSSSQMFPKKQYGFETRDSTGEDISVSLFGMPSEADWILSAQYNDKSLMRDALTYALSNSIGRYASRSRYCEVVLNGEYRGVYMLFEKIKRDKNRVNVSKLDSTGVFGDALTGGYIIKIDKLDGSGNDGWNSSFLPQLGSKYKILYQYHYPKPEDITEAQKNYIKNFVATFEANLFAPNYADTATGYSKYFDVPSMIDLFLINEMTKNVDGYRLSNFMYKDKDSKNPKLFFGPVWDYNHGFGNCDYYNASKIEGWQLIYLTSNEWFLGNDAFQVPFWWKKVLYDTLFRKRAALRWEELRKTKFSLPVIHRFVDSVAAHIDEAQQRNFVKWPILNTYVWPNYYVGGTYANEITYLKKWITDRVQWMDLELSGKILPAAKTPSSAPAMYRLGQNFPNPFNPTTEIEFQLPSEQLVSLRLYDVLGNEVRSLLHRTFAAGTHRLTVDAAALPSGIYFYRMNAGPFTSTQKMTLIK